jgi:hypothetical protein
LSRTGKKPNRDFPSARGGLEPGFRVLFSTIFHGIALESANRVENTGRQWKQNCCKLLQIYVLFLCWLYLLKPKPCFDFRIEVGSCGGGEMFVSWFADPI